MTEFTLDTSGAVEAIENDGSPLMRWPHLTPFEQGYVEAMLTTSIRWPDPAEGYGPSSSVVRFSDLAPETLAAIRKDCADFEVKYGERPLQEHGCGFWVGRQAGRHMPGFPPLTVTLNDAGKVTTWPAA